MLFMTISSTEFNQRTLNAVGTVTDGSVLITERGNPAYVLLTFAQYQRLLTGRWSIVDRLGMMGEAEFEAPKVGSLSRPLSLDTISNHSF